MGAPVGGRQQCRSGSGRFGLFTGGFSDACNGAGSGSGGGAGLPAAGHLHGLDRPGFDGLLAPRPAARRLLRASGWQDRLGQWHQGLLLSLARDDWVPDLAQDIGSRRWLRGAATLVGLSALAIALWPGFTPVEAAPSMMIDDRVRDEFRSQMIMPLALGGDSGRRMGATASVKPLAAAPERPRLDLVVTLARGDSFERMLRRAGLGQAEAANVAQMVAQAVPLAQIKPGTQVDITLGRRPEPGQPRPLEALSLRARFDLALKLERGGNGQLVLERQPIHVDSTPLRIRTRVGDSLYRSARAAGAPAAAVQEYLRALGQELDLGRDIRPGDEIDLIIAYRRAATGEVEVGQLEYAALLRDGQPRKQLLRWGQDRRFYEASGAGEIREGLVAPVAGPITSGYGMRRHPILGYRRMHAGLDFRARHGAPIYAVSDGRVEFAGRNGGYGNYVRLRHAGNLGSGYAHMSRIAVRAGEQVRRGQVIGYVGSTGLSTGPHLHYELYRNGQPVDPASVRFVTRAQLAGRELAAFRARLAALQQVEPGAALAPLAPQASEAAEPQREIDRIENRQRVG